MPAITGYEQAVTDSLLALLPGSTRDRLGNVTLTLGRGTPRRLVYCALDEVGYVVGNITDDGYLLLRRVGGGLRLSPLFDQQIEGQRVTVFGRKGAVPGVVAVRSTHLTRGRPAREEPPFTVDNAYVDVGASSRDEVLALGISILTPVSLTKRPHRYGDRLLAAPNAGRRAACAALASAALSRPRVRGSVVVAFTVQSLYADTAGLRTVLSTQGPFAGARPVTVPSKFAETTVETVADTAGNLWVRTGGGPRRWSRRDRRAPGRDRLPRRHHQRRRHARPAQSRRLHSVAVRGKTGADSYRSRRHPRHLPAARHRPHAPHAPAPARQCWRDVARGRGVVGCEAGPDDHDAQAVRAARGHARHGPLVRRPHGLRRLDSGVAAARSYEAQASGRVPLQYARRDRPRGRRGGRAPARDSHAPGPRDRHIRVRRFAPRAAELRRRTPRPGCGRAGARQLVYYAACVRRLAGRAGPGARDCAADRHDKRRERRLDICAIWSRRCPTGVAPSILAFPGRNRGFERLGEPG